MTSGERMKNSSDIKKGCFDLQPLFIVGHRFSGDSLDQRSVLVRQQKSRQLSRRFSNDPNLLAVGKSK